MLVAEAAYDDIDKTFGIPGEVTIETTAAFDPCTASSFAM